MLSVLGDNGYPYGMPHNHWYCDEDRRLYFHSGETRHKIDAIRANNKASYCVYNSGSRCGDDFGLLFRSVIVFGRINIVEDHAKALEICRKLSHVYTSDKDYIDKEIQSAGHRVLVFYVEIEHLSGKLVREQ